MCVRIVTSDQELESLRQPWNELLHSNPNHTPFQSWEWNYAWWRSFGVPGRLRLFIVEDAGQIVGIAPFFLATHYRGWPLRHLAFLACKRSDYLDFIVRAGAEPLFFDELFAHLQSADARPGGHLISLRELREASTNRLPMLRAGGRLFSRCDVRSAEPCVVIELPASWERFLASLGRQTRKSVGRCRKHLEAHHRIRLAAPVTDAERLRCLDDFVAIYRRRWEALTGAPVFNQPHALEFESELCRLGSDAGWYRMHLLYADEQAAAGSIGYLWNGTYYAGLVARDRTFDKYGVGTVLTSLIIQDCIARGCTRFDTMRGNEDYKSHWNGAPSVSYHVRLTDSRAALGYTLLADRLYDRLVRFESLHRMRARWLNPPPGAPRAASTQMP